MDTKHLIRVRTLKEVEVLTTQVFETGEESMKSIDVLASYIMNVSEGTINIGETASQMSVSKTNAGIVIQSAIYIESSMAWIIEHYFIGPLDQSKRAEEFMDHIMNTDWCPFVAKFKILTHIANNTPTFPPQSWTELNDRLHKVMMYRNAFAHGTIIGGKAGVRLKHFHKEPKETPLDDVYWRKAETRINECIDLLHKLAITTGTTQIANPPEVEDGQKESQA